ncbi:MAG: oxidoreductase [Anaerolineae bacterium]
MVSKWSVSDIPDQAGKTVIITGGNSGIGYEAARALAAKGARVILAVRSVDKGEQAAASIRQETPKAAVEVMALDLADQASVRSFAEAFLARGEALPILVNNAGVMALPYHTTADGFEVHFGTNHLGHYALTGLLLPAIMAAPGARVVTVSSSLHTRGRVNFDNLDGKDSYSEWGAYSQSKLANLLFAYELQRRFAANQVDAISVGCHPGYAATNLQHAGPRMSGSRLRAAFMSVGNRLFAQSAAMGALPTLYAATAPDVNGCDYIGPTGMGGSRGYPDKVSSNAASYDEALAKRLWQVSEGMTGVHYDFHVPEAVTH